MMLEKDREKPPNINKYLLLFIYGEEMELQK